MQEKFLQNPFSRDQVKVLRVSYDVSGITFVESGVPFSIWPFSKMILQSIHDDGSLALTVRSLRRPGLGTDSSPCQSVVSMIVKWYDVSLPDIPFGKNQNITSCFSIYIFKSKCSHFQSLQQN
jgi:hypothetical protein